MLPSTSPPTPPPTLYKQDPMALPCLLSFGTLSLTPAILPDDITGCTGCSTALEHLCHHHKANFVITCSVDLLKGGHPVTGTNGYYTADESQPTGESVAGAERLRACVQYERWFCLGQQHCQLEHLPGQVLMKSARFPAAYTQISLLLIALELICCSPCSHQ